MTQIFPPATAAPKERRGVASEATAVQEAVVGALAKTTSEEAGGDETSRHAARASAEAATIPLQGRILLHLREAATFKKYSNPECVTGEKSRKL